MALINCPNCGRPNVSDSAEKCPECGAEVTIARGTELGHIFKLGTKYSEAI